MQCTCWQLHCLHRFLPHVKHLLGHRAKLLIYAPAEVKEGLQDVLEADPLKEVCVQGAWGSSRALGVIGSEGRLESLTYSRSLCSLVTSRRLNGSPVLIAYMSGSSRLWFWIVFWALCCGRNIQVTL